MPDFPDFPPAVLAVLGELNEVAIPNQGATSQVWLVRCAAGMRVVKHANRSPFVDWLAREGHVLRLLHASGSRLPVPEVYFDGGKAEPPIPYLVMSWLPGEPLSEVLAREGSPQKRLEWMRKWGTLLRQIHHTPAPPELRRDGEWLSERLDTAARYIQAGYHLDADDPLRLLQQLNDNRPAAISQTLIHGDFMWDNVLVDGDNISGIVDWGGGAYGDPRYDLALAMLPREDGDLSPEEVSTFYAAYGREPLSESEYRYFTNLYEFF